MSSSNMGLIFGLVCGGGFSLIFAGIGAFLLYKNNQSRKKASASQSWSSTTGQITEAHVNRSTSTDSEGDMSYSYSPAVQYTYQVAGQAYSGKNLTFGFTTGFSSSSKAEAIIARYPVGSQVTVYYDPANPGEAVLERKAGGSTASLVLGIIFLVVGLCIGCGTVAGVLLSVMSK